MITPNLDVLNFDPEEQARKRLENSAVELSVNRQELTHLLRDARFRIVTTSAALRQCRKLPTYIPREFAHCEHVHRGTQLNSEAYNLSHAQFSEEHR